MGYYLRRRNGTEKNTLLLSLLSSLLLEVVVRTVWVSWRWGKRKPNTPEVTVMILPQHHNKAILTTWVICSRKEISVCLIFLLFVYTKALDILSSTRLWLRQGRAVFLSQKKKLGGRDREDGRQRVEGGGERGGGVFTYPYCGPQQPLLFVQFFFRHLSFKDHVQLYFSRENNHKHWSSTAWLFIYLFVCLFVCLHAFIYFAHMMLCFSVL